MYMVVAIPRQDRHNYEPCKSEYCSCLGYAITVCMSIGMYIVIHVQTLTNHSVQHGCLVISNKYMYNYTTTCIIHAINF